MESVELLDCLVGLAEEAGLRVRVLAGGSLPEGEVPTRSGACRIRDSIWVLLVPADPLEDRIEAVAAALAQHRPGLVEERYLPPAVRERIEALLPS